jgi:hypothetical protein
MRTRLGKRQAERRAQVEKAVAALQKPRS